MDRHGFIHEKLDIKILILFILQRLPEAVDGETLAELTFCDPGIGYFDYAESLAELVETEHITKNEKGYTITEKGRRNGSIIESSLPYSVRRKAEGLVRPVANSMRRDSMIRTGHKQLAGGGHMVELSMADGKGEIISLRLVAGTEEQAKAMEGHFRAKAEEFYNSIAQMLLEE